MVKNGKISGLVNLFLQNMEASNKVFTLFSKHARTQRGFFQFTASERLDHVSQAAFFSLLRPARVPCDMIDA
jgi:hypothetical protein